MNENLFDQMPSGLPHEFFQELVSGASFTLKKIVSRGHTTDWYDQDCNEWVVLLRGGAIIEFEQKDNNRLEPGDYLLIPAHRKHRVAWTPSDQETVWLALYFN